MKILNVDNPDADHLNDFNQTFYKGLKQSYLGFWYPFVANNIVRPLGIMGCIRNTGWRF